MVLQVIASLAPTSTVSCPVLISPLKFDVSFNTSNSKTVIVQFTSPAISEFLHSISPSILPEVPIVNFPAN